MTAAVAVCIVPAAYAITPEQAAANLQGAQQFSHLADKSYRTAMYNEHLASLAKGNPIYVDQKHWPAVFLAISDFTHHVVFRSS